ncbi:MAG: CDP-glycerol glycerophosphotransferase family protein [Bacteroidales bacterium]|nr:CDP-glycerol glycerophosphotransferase family protein [Bacteroidales bacterium]
MMKFLAHLICFCIYPFSFLFPRDKKKWAFGSFRGAFNDNAKYLFIHMSEHMPEIEVVWLSVSKSTVAEIRRKGAKAYHVLSPKGIWFALTSKYWFFNAYSSDIMFCFSGGATLVNLWHGLPLKRIEFGIGSGPLAKRYVEQTFRERFNHPEVFVRPDFVLSASEMCTSVFARSFRVNPEQCLSFGYPRNEILNWTEEKRKSFIRRYEPLATRELIDDLGRYTKVYFYLPTWRDSKSDFMSSGFDFRALDAVMRENDALFLLKPHANTKIDTQAFVGLTNLRLLAGTVDVYPILPYTDVLITDYSSILYDYLLMENKDVILYLFDYQEYENERSFNWPFDEMVIGRRAYDFAALLECLREMSPGLDEAKRQALLRKCWGESAMNACERIGLCFQQA